MFQLLCTLICSYNFLFNLCIIIIIFARQCLKQYFCLETQSNSICPSIELNCKYSIVVNRTHDDDEDVDNLPTANDSLPLIEQLSVVISSYQLPILEIISIRVFRVLLAFSK